MRNLLGFQIPDQTVPRYLFSSSTWLAFFSFLCLGRSIAKNSCISLPLPISAPFAISFWQCLPSRSGLYFPRLEYQSDSCLAWTNKVQWKYTVYASGGFIYPVCILEARYRHMRKPGTAGWRTRGCTEQGSAVPAEAAEDYLLCSQQTS